ncbi:hypothetical protein G2W53_007463 [Senna tora]|uniref:RNase H type-1 domain-containing protein n=1 Tax=Senna tora TaxID=362788 RepID=A0A835CEY7_9FABA|nr:hypothetical protein G2W53_007463 [Senna tora]
MLLKHGLAKHVYREGNSIVDCLAKHGLDRNRDFNMFWNALAFVASQLWADAARVSFTRRVGVG